MIIGSNILESKAIPLIGALPCDAIYLLIDEHIAQAHASRLAPLYALSSTSSPLTIEGGEACKSLETLAQVWTWLAHSGATRHSLLVVIGGGALLDLGGLAAATYMRGIATVNIPTSLLAMVDASVGGKTAIDFAGVKNLVGAFHQPQHVFIDVDWLDTLPIEELYSGYGEVLKTALLSGDSMWRRLMDLGDPQGLRPTDWIELVEQCVAYKQDIVHHDLYETTGLRKVLNLGHTIGHALEALSIESPRHRTLLHGEAVAVGLIVETYLAVALLETSRALLRQLVGLCRELYAPFVYTCRDYPRLLDLMRLDKKTKGRTISIIALRAIGDATEITIEDEELLKEALDFYRETFGG